MSKNSRNKCVKTLGSNPDMVQTAISKYFTSSSTYSVKSRKRDLSPCVSDNDASCEKVKKLDFSKPDDSNQCQLSKITKEKLINFSYSKSTIPEGKPVSFHVEKDCPEFPSSTQTSKVVAVQKLMTENDADNLGNNHDLNCLDNNAKYTPLEEQYLEIKKQYPDAVLLIECGYKYRFFDKDAEIASKELNIACFKNHNFMSAIIPVGRLSFHLRRLVMKGYKVGVVKQTESTALKAAGENRNELFSRKLHSLYTKATLIGEEFCEPDDTDEAESERTATDIDIGAGFLVCINEEVVRRRKSGDIDIAVVAIEICTGDIFYDLFEDNSTRSKLEIFLNSVDPMEILHSSTCLSKNTDDLLQSFCHERSSRIEKLNDTYFEHSAALDYILKFLSENAPKDSCSENSDDMQKVLTLPPLIISCLAPLIVYLKDFQLQNIMKNVKYMKRYSRSEYMNFSAATIKGLEILRSNFHRSEYGSLLWAIKRTKTKFGERMLKTWIVKPLKDLDQINERLDVVTEIIHSDSVVFKILGKILHKLPDLQRILCSVFHNKCSCSDFLKLVEALQKMKNEFVLVSEKIKSEVLTVKLKIILSKIVKHLENIDKLTYNINPEAARISDKTKIFIDTTMYPNIEKCKMEISNINKKLNDLRPKICKTLRLPGFNYSSVAGQKYLIEVPNSHLSVVPNDWLRISSTKQVTRFQSSDIIELCKSLDQLQETLLKHSNETWNSFMNEFSKEIFKYMKVVSYLAELDCYFSFASISKEQNYCRPLIIHSKEKQFSIKQGHHPCTTNLIDENKQFVANDLNLNHVERCAIITGPNMGGKSTFVRQIALIALMSHIGCYVPALSAKLPLFDGIYVRMGAEDDLAHKKSTFMCEMSEASEILSCATCNSLVVLDELGRGTSTHDGTAIAYATLEYMIKEVKCLTLFVTHYPDVMELRNIHFQNIIILHMAYILKEMNAEENSIESVTFLYNVVQGMCDKSYGINVAALAGISKDILKEAQIKSSELQEKIEMHRKMKSLIMKINSAFNLITD